MTDPDHDPILEAVCGRLMDLVIENATLRALVIDMALNIPRERLPDGERDLLDDTLTNWGKPS
jgi:hypothetical protein